MASSQHGNQAQLLEHISREAIVAERPWLALGAQTTADVMRLLQVSEETGAKLTQDVYDFVLSPTLSLTNSRLVQEAHRENVLTYMAEPARERIVELWSSLDHLDDVATPTGADIERQEAARLQGQSSRERRTYLQNYAQNMHRMSAAMQAAGMAPEAFRAAYRADLATYEVYCYDQASQSGDMRLASIDIRMAMAQFALASITPTDDLERNRMVIRNALTYASFAAPDIPWIN